MQKESPTLSFIKKAIASRKSRGVVSVEAIARQSDIHTTNLYKYLAGKTVLNADAFMRLLATLKLTEEEMRGLLEANKEAKNGNKKA
jgi:predicted transcriptional regulator